MWEHTKSTDDPTIAATAIRILAEPLIAGDLFQVAIEILRWAVLAIVGQIACGLQPGNRGRVSGVLVGVDDTRMTRDAF